MPQNDVMKRSWSDNQLIEAVKISTSMAAVLKILGFPPVGSHYNWIKKHIKRLELDTSHFLPYVRQITKKLSTKELFEKGASPKVIKNRILKEKLKKYICEGCEITKWTSYNNSYSLSLHLDHIDGDNMNNSLENLRFLCPNCHSVTNTYCGKNAKKESIYLSCLGCSKTIDKGLRCVECKEKYALTSENVQLKVWPSIENIITKIKEVKSLGKTAFFFNVSTNGLKRHLDRINKLEEIRALLEDLNKKPKKERTTHKTKINWPSKEVLEKLVWEKSTVKLSLELGVSDKAIEKRCKKYNINKPPRGYWTKLSNK